MHGVPAELRGAVLRDVQRELRSARSDRRLARTAAALLVVGVGLNAAALLPGHSPSPQVFAVAPTQESFVQVAISVAEATDNQTGRQVARRLATMSGRPLSGEDAAAVDAAIEGRSGHGILNRKEG